jgi:putative SOS response-associated peptidase YedK
MCNQYAAPTQRQLLAAKWRVTPPAGEWPEDVFPGNVGPIIRRPRHGEDGERQAVLARFGLLPWFAKSEKLSFSTMNARSETAATAASYKAPVVRRQWCIIPATRFYEPYYDPDRWNAGVHKSERYSVARVDGEQLGIAGLWERWKRAPDDPNPVLSFTMLTINSDKHPLLSAFHKPFDDNGEPNEKRTVVLLRESQYDEWLNADAEAMPSLLGTFDASELVAAPAPLPPRPKKPPAKAGGRQPPEQLDLELPF